jgi:hypothetical protein
MSIMHLSRVRAGSHSTHIIESGLLRGNRILTDGDNQLDIAGESCDLRNCDQGRGGDGNSSNAELHHEGLDWVSLNLGIREAYRDAWKETKQENKDKPDV